MDYPKLHRMLISGDNELVRLAGYTLSTLDYETVTKFFIQHGELHMESGANRVKNTDYPEVMDHYIVATITTPEREKHVAEPITTFSSDKKFSICANNKYAWLITNTPDYILQAKKLKHEEKYAGYSNTDNSSSV